MSATPELATQLDAERAEAIQHLLRRPLLDVGAHHDAYTLVARHAPWLADWFDTTCGWTLHVDPAAGFARLAKRHADPDPTRPLRRLRGSGAPFDRRRYQLLCLVAAELVSHPVTTVGLLARAVGSSGGFEAERHGDRVAFVDALLVLRAWRAVEVTSGDVEDYVGNEKANALLTADLSRLHRLLVPATAPSRVDPGSEFAGAVDALLREPRYDGTHLDTADPHRATRHLLARRLLDDPVLHLADCTDDQRDYLASGAGRTWLRARVAEAGLILEERAEGLAVVDEAGRTTDDTFPAPNGTVHQMALLLVDHLVAEVPSDEGIAAERRPRTRTRTELVAAVDDHLAARRTWAKAYQEPGGAERLGAEAVALLASFGLVRPSPDGAVVEARPALCRYRPLPVGEDGGRSTAGSARRRPDPAPTLFEKPTLFEET